MVAPVLGSQPPPGAPDGVLSSDFRLAQPGHLGSEPADGKFSLSLSPFSNKIKINRKKPLF